MKICSQCGSQQDDDAVFCNKCGYSFNNSVITPQPPQYQPPQYQPQPQFAQQQFQPQFAQAGVQNSPPVSNASKKKLIIVICAITAAIVITLLILFLFVFKSKKDLIIGTWQEIKENGSGSYTRFYKDGTVDLTVGTDNKAMYTIDGDALIFTKNSTSIKYDIVELTSDKMTLKMTYNEKAAEVNFKKIDDEKAEKEVISKAYLKTANSNAKLVFTSMYNKASDIIADGERVAAVKMNGAVSVDSLKDSSDPLLKAVYEALEGNETAYGYVYIHFDPDQDNSDNNFVQWSDSESGGLIGQYPTPAKTAEEAQGITFGEKHTN